ncbi:hypothetical protein NESM_000540800 [Novymonas esmeraldas]|uniref:Uncharacterized protein n=1 Tax=Novymonas esmeraldas TaxID=1808958 RepID=A0AAW0EQX2_9TRYP
MAEAQLTALLQGVVSERGATVTCRDPSALEMVLRIGGSDAHRGCVSAIFHSSSAASPATAQMLFINAKFAKLVEDEVQSWLDPFKTAATAAAVAERKRTRADSDSDSYESDSDSGA